MKPYTKLAETETPEGESLELFEHDGSYFISSDGQRLMTSLAHGSEEELARIACQPFRLARQPVVLIGGLGMGYTLAAAVDSLPQKGASFVVAELTEAILDWNKTHMKDLHPSLLDDPRVAVRLKPVQQVMLESSKTFSAIMLDVDNGPSAFHGEENNDLYTLDGIHLAKNALKEGGILAVWSAYKDHKYTKLLRKSGMDVSVIEVPAAHKGRKNRLHTIWIAKKGEYVSQNAKAKPNRR